MDKSEIRARVKEELKDNDKWLNSTNIASKISLVNKNEIRKLRDVLEGMRRWGEIEFMELRKATNKNQRYYKYMYRKVKY